MSTTPKRYPDTRLPFLRRCSTEESSSHANPIDAENSGVINPEVLPSNHPVPEKPIAANDAALIKRSEQLPVRHRRSLPAIPDAPKIPQPVFSLPPDLTKQARALEKMASTLDLDLPEGYLDRWGLRRADYRLRMKVDRAALVAEFQSKMAEIVRLKANEAEDLRRFYHSQNQQFIDGLDAWRTALEAYYRAFLVEERIEHERAIEAARTRAEIAKYEEEALTCRRRCLPPSTPDPGPVDQAKARADIARYEAEEAKYKREKHDAEREPAPPLDREEAKARHRERLRDDIARWKRDEERDIEAITHGTPFAELPGEMQEEVKRIENRYMHARERKRTEMEESL